MAGIEARVRKHYVIDSTGLSYSLFESNFFQNLKLLIHATHYRHMQAQN